jgi:hypothetical protein
MLRAEFLDLEIGDRLTVIAPDSPDHNKHLVIVAITPNGRLDVDKGLPFKIGIAGRLVHVKISGEDRVGVLEPDDCEFLCWVDPVEHQFDQAEEKTKRNLRTGVRPRPDYVH